MLGTVVVVVSDLVRRVHFVVHLTCFAYRAVVAVAVVAVLHAPVVLCPVCSCLQFLVLVPVVRLLESWIVLVRLSMVHVVVLVHVLVLSEHIRVLVFVCVDCPVVTVVSISVVCLCKVLEQCLFRLPVVLTVFEALHPGVGHLYVVLTFRVKER